MLEYVQTVLQKVSFSRSLFEKELRKSFRFLNPGELRQLKRWCYARFTGKFLPILDRVFAGAML